MEKKIFKAEGDQSFDRQCKMGAKTFDFLFLSYTF